MSRIGNNPISIPESVTINYNDMIITVKGKMGELSQDIDKSINVNIQDNKVTLTRSSEEKDI